MASNHHVMFPICVYSSPNLRTARPSQNFHTLGVTPAPFRPLRDTTPEHAAHVAAQVWGSLAGTGMSGSADVVHMVGSTYARGF